MAAELVVLLVLAGLLYLALTPVRRTIERRYLRWRGSGRRGATVIPLVRRSDGVFAPSRRKENDHGHKR